MSDFKARLQAVEKNNIQLLRYESALRILEELIAGLVIGPVAMLFFEASTFGLWIFQPWLIAIIMLGVCYVLQSGIGRLQNENGRLDAILSSIKSGSRNERPANKRKQGR
jgi:F0F1-type ATP synthase assembly protein I